MYNGYFNYNGPFCQSVYQLAPATYIQYIHACTHQLHIYSTYMHAHISYIYTVHTCMHISATYIQYIHACTYQLHIYSTYMHTCVHGTLNYSVTHFNLQNMEMLNRCAWSVCMFKRKTNKTLLLILQTGYALTTVWVIQGAQCNAHTLHY